MNSRTFLVDVNQAFTGKTKRQDMYLFNRTFETVELNLDQLLYHVHAGHSFTAPFAKVLREGKKTPRLKVNVISVQVLALDFDTENEHSTFDYLIRQELVSRYGAALYTTASHTPEKPRCRLLFVLEEELKPEEAELATKALMAQFPHDADQSAKDAGRVFYGAKGCVVKRLGNVLTRSFLEEVIIQPYLDTVRRSKRPKREKVQTLRNVDASADQVERYVASTFQRVIQDVSKAVEGTGQRHERLRGGSVRLFSLQKATWLTPGAAERLKYLEDELLEAARANGYVSKYGEEDTLRIIRSGAEMATPAHEPRWRGYTNHMEVEPTNVSKMSTFPTTEPEEEADEADKKLAWRQPPPQPPANVFQAANGRLNAIHTVDVPKDAFLSQVDFQIPERAVLDANTGIGKSHWAATMAKPSERTVVAMSSIVALRQQAVHHEGAAVVYEHEKTLTPSSRLAFVTYDQLPAVAKLLKEWQVDFSSVRLVIDEQHNLALASYRRRTLDAVLCVVANYKWKSVTFMSGTPLSVPHSALKDFEYVKVNSHRRTQNAVLVRWQNEEGEGKKRDTIVELVKRHRRVLIHLDNKGSGLDALVAALVASGVNLSTIYTLNSDNKYEPLGEQITEHETVPDNCHVLIVTSVFVESSNMRTLFDAGIIASPINPSYAQQFANRQRGTTPMEKVYVLHKGKGQGWNFDATAELNHTNRLAEQLATTLNAIEDARATISEDARRVFGGEYGALVKRQNERFVVDELGVAQHVHRSATLYSNENARCYKNLTVEYGWNWLEDEQLMVTKENKTAAQHEQEKQLRQEYTELAKADWLKRVRFVHELGPERAENERFLAMYQTKIMRVIERALKLAKLTDDWTSACALLATARDSTQSYNKLKRLVIADKLRQSGDSFVEAIQTAFVVDQTYTQDKRHQLLVEVYKNHDNMRPFVEEVYRYSWSKEPRAKIDKRTADDMLRLLFEVKEQRVRTEGKQVRQWLVTGTEPLKQLLEEGQQVLSETPEANAVPVPPNYLFIKDKNKFSGTAPTKEFAVSQTPATGPPGEEEDSLDWFLEGTKSERKW